MVTQLTMKFVSFMRIKGKRRRIMSGKINGTVFSGHPTRTTFGNSMRVYLYTKFILYRVGINKFKIWV